MDNCTLHLMKSRAKYTKLLYLLSSSLLIAASVIASGQSTVTNAFAQTTDANQTSTAPKTTGTANATTSSASTNQSNASALTGDDLQEIRKHLDNARVAISDGDPIKALKEINAADNQLLVITAKNPPKMLQDTFSPNAGVKK